MAPTGIAAKRLSLVTGFFAGTIHRILGYDGTSWGFNCDNKFSTNAVIIDEASMLSQELFYRILDALYDDTIIVLVGDDAQLPSVGSGNVLRELINCSVIPTVRLTQIFRQANESKIIVNAHRINSGMSLSPEVMDAKSDFCFVPLKENQDESEIIEWIVKAALILKGRNANFQVLSPMYKGVLGVDELNRHLREALNPLNDRKREVRIGNLIYRDGDRVMIVKNNYKLGVFNGDMGKILSVGYNEFLIKIHEIDSKISETIIRVPVKDIVTQISLAYAITVHKCQGNEFDTVIIPIVNSQKNMLQRNLFYTAVTRARSKVWVLGHASAVNRAISNNKVVFRNTGLSRALVSMFNSKSG
jgi:exodeoxyribonuclease V alpha subunit